jgi:Uncharacterized protein conserved in bacteria (DUF2147)
MHRLFPAAAILVALGSPVHAADSFSFAIGGHWIQISAPHYSISPGMTRRHAHPERDRQIATTATPAAAPAAASVDRPAQPALCSAPLAPLHPAAPQVQPIAPPPVQRPQIQPVQAQPAQQTQPVQAIPVPVPAPVTTAAITPPPQPLPVSPASPPPASPPQQVVPPVETAPQVTNDPPKIAKVSQEIEEAPADTPLGDWHAEGQKGLVRIEPCGRSLCGYTVDAATNAKGETILVDMKSKSASKWSGNIYSRDSGNTYYGTMTMKGTNSLHVEACALGHFFCSGTTWRRADAQPKKLVSDREILQPPRT